MRSLRISRIGIALASFISAGVGFSSSAQAQTVEWRGFAYLSDFSAACAANGWQGTPQMYVRFRPSGLGSNGNSSRLSFFDRFYAFGFYLDGQRFDRTWRNVFAGGVGSSPFNWPDGTQIRVQTQTPSNNNLRATTPQVRLVGQIRNFEVQNCTVSFEATVLLRR